jgi:hypothetical protein
LASEVGFDMDAEKKKYWWYMRQMLLTEMPMGWEREIGYEGQTIYNNTKKNVSIKTHPMKGYFR